MNEAATLEQEAGVADAVGEPNTTPDDVEAMKKRPKPKPKGPKYEAVTVGRIIHVVADQYLASVLSTREGAHLAAIVTAVHDPGDAIQATIFSPVGNNPKNGVYLTHNELAVPASWHWPERDDA